jgi:transposase
VAALDIGKAEVVRCVRVPHEDKPGRRLQEVATYSTMTRRLLVVSDHLRCLGVRRVVMEATSEVSDRLCTRSVITDRSTQRDCD